MPSPSRLPRLALAHPRWTLAAWGLLVLLAVPGLARLELAVDGRSLVPEQDPAVERDRALRQRFGVRDPLALVIQTGRPEGLWTPAALEAVAELTAALEELPDIERSDLVSLATERTIRPVPDSLARRVLVPPGPVTPELAAEIRADAHAVGYADGFLAARDGSAAAIYLGVPPGADREALLVELEGLGRTVLARHRTDSEPSLSLDLVGAPAAEALLGSHVLADLGVPESLLEAPRVVLDDGTDDGTAPADVGGKSARGLDGPGMVPLALVVMAGVLFLAFRRAVAVALPLAKIGAVLVLVLGTMGWLGVPVHLTTAILPVVLLVLAVADEIHLLRRARELVAEGAEARDAVAATLDELAAPVVRTSLTTAVGFVSFALSPIGPVRLFGLLTAFGVGLAALWAVTATPVLLAAAARILGPTAWAPRPGGRPPDQRLAVGLGAVARAALARPRRVAAGALVVLAVAALGASRLEVHDSWTEGFDPDSPFSRATERFEEGFLGAHLLLVELEGRPLHLVGTDRWEPGGVAEADVDRTASDASPESLHRTLWLPLGPARTTDGTDIVPGALPPLHGSDLLLVEEEPSGRSGDADAPPREAPRRWSGWADTVRVEPAPGGREGSGERLALELPLRAGSPRFSLRPKPGAAVTWELDFHPFLSPAVLEATRDLEAYLDERPEVGGVVGPARIVETASFLRRFGEEGSRRLPALPFEAEMAWNDLARAVGEERRARVVEADTWGAALVTVFLRDADSDRVARLLDALDAFAAERLAPAGLTIRTGGDAVVSQALIGAVVQTQLASLAVALLGLAVAAWWIGGRGIDGRGGGLAGGLAVGAPAAFAVLLVFGAMGWLGVPLGVATAMFAGMTLGLGIDAAIHLHARFEHLLAGGRAPKDAAAATVASVGPAILVDVAAVGLGFAVLTTSDVPANARLGGLLLLSIASCFVASLLFAPLLLARSGEGRGQAAPVSAPISEESAESSTDASSAPSPVASPTQRGIDSTERTRSTKSTRTR